MRNVVWIFSSKFTLNQLNFNKVFYCECDYFEFEKSVYTIVGQTGRHRKSYKIWVWNWDKYVKK